MEAISATATPPRHATSARSGGRRAAWTVRRQSRPPVRRTTGELPARRRGEVAAADGVRTSPPRWVTSRFDCAYSNHEKFVDPGGFKGMVGQDADRGDSRVKLKASRRAVGAHRRDL